MQEIFDQFDRWVYELVAQLQGMDGLTLLIIILLFAMLFYVARPDGSRRDSKRRNQAHRMR